MMDKCDKCKTDILMDECSCGRWFKKGEHPKGAGIFEQALLAFDRVGSDVISADHWTGGCFVFFKGDHEKCKKVRKYVEGLDGMD